MRFADRRDAGRRLGDVVVGAVPADAIVLALPRGGAPVAFEVARALRAPVDVLGVRKLGVPAQPELAMGAIGEDGVRVVDPVQMARSGVSARALAAVEAREQAELDRRLRRYRGDRPPVDVRGRTVVVVDDGLATGLTARAAARVARARGASHVVLAVPVAPPDALDVDRLEVDAILTVMTPPHFLAVGEWYEDFGATSDDEVIAVLAASTTDQEPEVAPDDRS